MGNSDVITKLAADNGTKIVMLVADGLGGLPIDDSGKTELEAAITPNLDALAERGTSGLSVPIGPGITPGSGPGHLGLFGYDPLAYDIGRGVLEALGIGFEMTARDVATRGNFCTVDRDGRITDRRAGRIPDETCTALCKKLRTIQLPDTTLFVEPVREHRLVVVFRRDGLEDRVADTDPQKTGVPPLSAVAEDADSEPTAQVANQFLDRAREVLEDDAPANMVMLRGFAKYPSIPPMQEAYKLRACAIAGYPMYRGLASLVGMAVVETGSELPEEVACLRAQWDRYDFFFVHYKYTDSRGEDGNFDAKVERIEALDAAVPDVLRLRPDVLVVTGDHSTPARMKMHSWHPVPTLLWSETCRPDAVRAFGERDCLQGGLGRFQATDLMPLMLAHAGRLGKYGA